jgi:predicted metal-dependent hydrolase
VDDARVEDIIASKRYWIYKNLAEWRDLNATRVLREYKNGEGFLYLGRAYRLLLVSDQAEALQGHHAAGHRGSQPSRVEAGPRP